MRVPEVSCPGAPIDNLVVHLLPKLTGFGLINVIEQQQWRFDGPSEKVMIALVIAQTILDGIEEGHR